MSKTNDMLAEEFEAKLKRLILKGLKSRRMNLAELVAINHHTMCAVVEILAERIKEERVEL